MATAARDTLTPIVNLASLFLGKSGSSTTSGGSSSETGTVTNTVQDIVPQAAVDAAIKSILEGNSGLAAVASGQKVAGLYNSSTNTLLANDLVARAAAAGAALNKTQTTTQTRNLTTVKEPTVTTQTTNPQISPATGLGILGALQILPTLKDSVSGILGKKKFNVNDFEDAEPGGSTESPSTGVDASTGIPAVSSSSTPSVDVASIAQATGLDEGIMNATSNIVDIGTNLGTATDVGSNLGNIGADILGQNADLIDAITQPDFDWNSLDIGFARGGLVKPKGYAEGGKVEPINGLTLDTPDIRKQWEQRLNAVAYQLGSSQWYPRGPDYLQNRVDLINLVELLNSLTPVLGNKAGAGRGFVNPPNVTPGYAEGGVVSNSSTNTGLRTTPAKGLMNITPESNQILSDALQSAASQLVTVAPVASTKTTSPTETTKKTSSSSSSSSASNSVGAGDGASTPAGVTPGASNSGIDVNSTALSGMLAMMGISAPGMAGLATSDNNSQAVNSTVAGMAGITGGLALGLPGALLSALLAKSLLSSQTPAASTVANSSPVGDPVEGSIAVSNPNGGMQSSTPGMIDALGLLGITPNQSINPGVGQSNPGFGGLSAESGGSVSDSSGAAVGTDGDGGVGAGAALKAGGKVPGDDPTHSDSVPAKLTNGEFVVNRNATQAFLPILEIINNMIPATPTPANPLGVK